MKTTKRVKNLSQTAESRLKGTGLLSKQEAFRRSGVSWSTFIRALSINCVAVDPKDLKHWKQLRKGYSLGNGKKKKRFQSIPKIGDQARRRTNESAR